MYLTLKYLIHILVLIVLWFKVLKWTEEDVSIKLLNNIDEKILSKYRIQRSLVFVVGYSLIFS